MARKVRKPRGWLRRTWRGLCWAVLLWLVLTLATVLALRWLAPPTSAFMLARSLQAWRHDEAGFALDFRWQPATQISSNLPIAVVGAEDQKFPLHHGFDVVAIQEALADENGRMRGASTISQQVAKNLFLNSSRSWLRKGLEAYFTGLIELTWSKRRILEVYVNIAEFGDGIYGAEAASQRFFGKPAARLTAHEAALLAAVLPNPKILRANKPSAYVLRRAAWIERQVRQLGGPTYLGSP